MTNSLQKQSQSPNTDASSTQRPNRRVFLFTAASACGVAALAAWCPSSVAAASGGAGDPSTVAIVQFSDVGKATGKVTVLRVVRSEAEWKQKLSPISFDVTRREGTERPYSGSTWNNHDHGFYRCICCDNAIFSSETKFESGTGWPSLWQPIAKEMSSRLPIGVWAWSVRLSPVASAMLISATSSMTVPAQPAFATA
jgi:peptide-methionine (R)-S-oxide reductase